MIVKQPSTPYTNKKISHVISSVLIITNAEIDEFCYKEQNENNNISCHKNKLIFLQTKKYNRQWLSQQGKTLLTKSLMEYLKKFNVLYKNVWYK